MSRYDDAKRSYFLVSLDFELAWGFHDSDLSKTGYVDNIKGARTSVLKTLELFEKHKIHATWATVGALFCHDKKELEGLINSGLVYSDTKHSLREYLEKMVGGDQQTDPLHYASSLIERIRTYENQEIGAHTFSHFTLLDRTNDPNAFEKELVGMSAVCPGVESMVFPKNQSVSVAVDILK